MAGSAVVPQDNAIQVQTASAKPPAIPPVVKAAQLNVAPVNIVPAPLDVKEVAESFRQSFLHRVATGGQTSFNACFTRTGNPVLASSVDKIRGSAPIIYKASAIEPETDYALPPIVVLDPGHGSEGDPGAGREGVRETTIIDAIAVKLKSALERKGAEVVGTRAPIAKDIHLTSRYRFKDQDRVLQWRAELTRTIAQEFPGRPFIAISLHADTSPSPHSSGAGVFYYAGTGAHSAQSEELAYSIAAKYRTSGGSKVKAGDLGYLRCQNKDTPVVLLELGYLTNDKDFDFLRAAAGSERESAKIAGMITNGIFDYLDRKKREHAPTQVARAHIDMPQTSL